MAFLGPVKGLKSLKADLRSRVGRAWTIDLIFLGSNSAQPFTKHMALGRLIISL